MESTFVPWKWKSILAHPEQFRFAVLYNEYVFKVACLVLPSRRVLYTPLQPNGNPLRLAGLAEGQCAWFPNEFEAIDASRDHYQGSYIAEPLQSEWPADALWSARMQDICQIPRTRIIISMVHIEGEGYYYVPLNKEERRDPLPLPGVEPLHYKLFGQKNDAIETIQAFLKSPC